MINSLQQVSASASRPGATGHGPYFSFFDKQDPKQANPFSLDGINTYARVISIYDADTLTILLPLDLITHPERADQPQLWQGPLRRFHIRILGVNAPELKSHDTVVKSQAYAARNAVFQYITNHTPSQLYAPRSELDAILAANTYLVHASLRQPDKYGRTLAVVSKPDATETLGEFLLSKKLAVPYSV